MVSEGTGMPQDTQLEEKYKPLKNLIMNEALIEHEPTLQDLNLQTLEKGGEGSIYYGTGLTTPKAIMQGIPFDILGMVLVAERIRRTLGYREIFHHVADTHAKTNEWIDPVQVDEKAAEVRETLARVSRNLGLDNLRVVMSSEFDSLPEYLDLVNHFKSNSDQHEYVIREMADMEWYRKNHGLSIKMGWIIQATETELGFDERLFDREYKRIMGEQISFVYTKPGRTLDLSRPKVSPYIQIEGEARVLLKKGENVASKLSEATEKTGDKHLGGARKHLESIVRTYEKLFGSLGRDPLEQKIQNIIDKATE
jgi:hypothetical protein